jgi:hypothetical protein
MYKLLLDQENRIWRTQHQGSKGITRCIIRGLSLKCACKSSSFCRTWRISLRIVVVDNFGCTSKHSLVWWSLYSYKILSFFLKLYLFLWQLSNWWCYCLLTSFLEPWGWVPQVLFSWSSNNSYILSLDVEYARFYFLDLAIIHTFWALTLSTPGSIFLI